MHIKVKSNCIGHNPYFSRWFSAISSKISEITNKVVTILILVDGFLQFSIRDVKRSIRVVTILILVDGFLQSRLAWIQQKTGKSQSLF